MCIRDRDKIIWDVGHQSYTHKILSGRMEEFDELRQFGGLSGFPKRKESPYDSFDTGPVSYTHLDVYKRQVWRTLIRSSFTR